MKKITFTLLLLFGLLLNNYAAEKQIKAAETKSGDAFSTELGGALGVSQVSGTVLSIENIVVGSVDNPQDFTGTVSISYDLDSVYMMFNITDDSIVNTGTSYQVDNIEVYLDLDNSKNVHYPRNAGWSATDASFDANDRQLRLVPDVAFATNNGSFAGAHQIYKKTETGYSFQLNVEWTSLMPGFAQVSSTSQVSNTLIGFDVLVSDNDAVASDANRNQITFNSSTDKPYNDPSLWGTLKMLEDGSFEVVLDETKPSVPANLDANVADNSNIINLTWDASTDNIGVLSYIVAVDGTEEAPIFAKAEGALEYALKDMANGTYVIKVKANDNNSNQSDYSASVDAIINVVSIDDMKDIVFGTYPNPASNLLFINNASTIKSVEIISINGSVLTQKANDQSELMSLNVSGLAKGIYILKMQTVNGSVVTSKLVKE